MTSTRHCQYDHVFFRCPNCGSTNTRCVPTFTRHSHVCFDCDHQWNRDAGEPNG